MRNSVVFQNNVPVELALAFPEGKIVTGRYGDRVMHSLDFPGQHVMFLSLAVAQRLNHLELQPGEHFFICKRPKNGSVPGRWDLWLAPATEQQRAAKEMQEPEPPELPPTERQ